MKAVQVRQWGGFDAANIEETERPHPGHGEVLVRIKATSINPVDWKIREGYLAEYVSLPYALGSDVAGDIEALGEGVNDLQVGTPIYGMQGLRGGAYAEYAVMSTSNLARKPATLTYAQAAAIPHAALTAWQSLFDAADLRKGQRVLIHAAAGGVGHFAVQFAKWKGAYVIGTASAQNESFVRELGADEFVNYQTTPFETVIKDVDVVLDTVGFDTSERSIKVLRPGGILVCLVTPPPAEAAALHQVQVKYIGAQPNTEDLTEIAQLIDEGQVKPHVSHVMKLDQTREALQINQLGHTRGKIVLTVDG